MKVLPLKTWVNGLPFALLGGYFANFFSISGLCFNFIFYWTGKGEVAVLENVPGAVLEAGGGTQTNVLGDHAPGAGVAVTANRMMTMKKGKIFPEISHERLFA